MTQQERRTLWRTAEGALALGIAAANGVPFAGAALVLLWSLFRLHDERMGKRATAGIVIASVSLVALIAVLTASVAAGKELHAGPTYILGTLGSIIGIGLFCADAARAGLLPRRALWFWAIAWTIGGMLGLKGSQLVLAAAYSVLLVHVHKSQAVHNPS